MSLLDYIKLIPKGYSEVLYRQRKYGVTRTDFNRGRSIKVFAEELGGNDLISMNYYITNTSENLKPCEMTARKVIDFIMKLSIIEKKKNDE
ncbi:MAG: peptide methionine sulfoxide reductase [Maribacter sp.]|nr:peptide methionine sulfoxide reductase [Maribacter sp.]